MKMNTPHKCSKNLKAIFFPQCYACMLKVNFFMFIPISNTTFSEDGRFNLIVRVSVQIYVSAVYFLMKNLGELKDNCF